MLDVRCCINICQFLLSATRELVNAATVRYAHNEPILLRLCAKNKTSISNTYRWTLTSEITANIDIEVRLSLGAYIPHQVHSFIEHFVLLL